MDLKIRVFLLLLVVVFAVYHVQANKMCDWPDGTCTYYKDPCPPNWERCAQYDYDCPLKTNHCCCRRKPFSPVSPATPAKEQMCDWPRGTCTYIIDPCPPNWKRCPQYDDCPVKTNHCCCPEKPVVQDVPAVTVSEAPCDWPSGTCTYTGDPCPPNWKRCPDKDGGCKVPTNHCCCRTTTTPPPGKCDWPYGTCTYYGDPCPPNWERCPQYDIDCKLRTNHCCCREQKPKAVQDASVKCDWPDSTCTYNKEPCPPNMERCSDRDAGCTVKTNHCCCNKKSKREPNPVAVKREYPCDWPDGTCTYIGDPCPPYWHRCPQYDSGCKRPTNHCCCRP